MFILSIIFIILALVSADPWTVIVAGSDGYYNYRHQSDACHAYQIHKRNGIAASNIILFSYDDVAKDSYNPIKNSLYNHPGDGSPNNYEGCVIDYKGKDCTPEVYLAVLTGDAATVTKLTGIQNPKVLKSNSDDNVFLSFFDHGAPGIIAFPVGKQVTATQLNDALQKMHRNNMYRKLVYYMEACESGSMFYNLLPKDINIYATTASNPTESSWATYCGSDAIVDGIDIGSCLGDLYSVVWMEDADKGIKTETLNDSWKIILDGTDMSHPQQYGDLTYVNDLFFSFIGSAKAPRLPYTPKSRLSWDSRDVGLKTFEYLSVYGHTEEIKIRAQGDLIKLKNHIAKIDSRFLSLTRELVSIEENRYLILTSKENIITDKSEKCYFSAVEAYQQYCGLHDYDLKYYSVILNICNLGKETSDVINTLKSLCN